jgi:hypothetical protein
VAFQADRTNSKDRETPAAEGAAAGSSSPAQESLSWIRALASQWEDDRSSPAALDEVPRPPAE